MAGSGEDRGELGSVPSTRAFKAKQHETQRATCSQEALRAAGPAGGRREDRPLAISPCHAVSHTGPQWSAEPGWGRSIQASGNTPRVLGGAAREAEREPRGPGGRRSLFQPRCRSRGGCFSASDWDACLARPPPHYLWLPASYRPAPAASPPPPATKERSLAANRCPHPDAASPRPCHLQRN